MTQNKHLSDQQIAMMAEAISDNAYENTPREVRDHLAECDQCAHEVMMVHEVCLELEQPLQKNQPKIKSLYARKTWLAATLLAAAMVILVITFFHLTGDLAREHTAQQIAQQHDALEKPAGTDPEATDTTPDSMPQATDPEAADKKQDISDTETPPVTETPEIYIAKNNTKPTDKKESTTLLAAFTPDPTLEALFENMQGAYRGSLISVSSPPVIHFSPGDSIFLHNPERKELSVEFFNNQGEEITYIVMDDESLAIPVFDKGLYYWKLINSDFDLLYVGKIVIE